jgi:hypothetical protein
VRSSFQQNETQLSAVNVYLKESNGSLTRTCNARISLYVQLNITSHIEISNSTVSFVCIVGSAVFIYLYKAFYRKKIPRKIKEKKYISPP